MLHKYMYDRSYSTTKNPLIAPSTDDVFDPQFHTLRLFWAIMTQACQDLGSKSKKQEFRKAREEARRWLDTPDFEYLCEILGLSPAEKRAKMLHIYTHGYQWRLPPGEGKHYRRKRKSTQQND